MWIVTFLTKKSFQFKLFSETQSLPSVFHLHGSMDSWSHSMETLVILFIITINTNYYCYALFIITIVTINTNLIISLHFLPRMYSWKLFAVENIYVVSCLCQIYISKEVRTGNFGHKENNF